MKVKWKVFLDKAEYIWEYYKWFIILPILVIIIIVYVITTYIHENREVALSIAIMNTNDTYDLSEAVEHEYAAFRGEAIADLPFNIATGFVHPKVMDETAASDSYTAASIQKYQVMVTKERVDVTITTPWVIDEYEKADVYCELDEIFNQEFLDRNQDRIVYAENSEGNEVPVALNLEGCTLLGTFYEEGTPIVAIPTYSNRKEEASIFVQWLIES